MQSREPERPFGRGAQRAEGTGETTDAVEFDGEPITPQHADAPADARRGRRVDTAATAREREIGLTRLEPDDRVIELREERLVVHRDANESGEVVVRKQVDEVPGRIEADALREEVEVERVPVGEAVSDRREPWEEDGALIVPVYEEQLVLVKRLLLREKLRIRRVQTTEHRVFEDTLRKERLVVEDTRRPGETRRLDPVGPPTTEPRPTAVEPAVTAPVTPATSPEPPVQADPLRWANRIDEPPTQRR